MENVLNVSAVILKVVLVRDDPPLFLVVLNIGEKISFNVPKNLAADNEMSLTRFLAETV